MATCPTCDHNSEFETAVRKSMQRRIQELTEQRRALAESYARASETLAEVADAMDIVLGLARRVLGEDG